MPSGGTRAGAGRPKGAGRGHRVEVRDLDGLLPVEWMLAVMRDPLTEPARRDRMAEVAAPYIHSRLAAVAVTGGEIKGAGDKITNNYNTVNIFAVPRGAALDLKTGTVSLENGSPTTLDPVEPFTGTPALTDQSDTTQASEQTNKPADPLPVQRVDTSNVTRLDRAFERALANVGKRTRPPDTSDLPTSDPPNDPPDDSAA